MLGVFIELKINSQKEESWTELILQDLSDVLWSYSDELR